MSLHNDVWGIDAVEGKKESSIYPETKLRRPSKPSASMLPPLYEQQAKAPQRDVGLMFTESQLPSLPAMDVTSRPGSAGVLHPTRSEGGEEGNEDGRECDEKVDLAADCDSETDDGLTLSVITEWEDTLRNERSRGAKDFALFALESIFELVESRMELQDRVYEKSPGVFKSLYGKYDTRTAHTTASKNLRIRTAHSEGAESI